MTGRGRSFLVVGVLVAVAAVLFGDRDLARIAALLLVVPAIAAVVVRRITFRLTCAHSLDPTRIAAGGRASVVVSVRNVAQVPTGVMLVEDTLPYLLGGRPRFRINRMAPDQLNAVRYPVRADARGRYPVGPLTVRVRDPFGMVELTHAFSGIDMLTVTPAVTPLPETALFVDRSGGDGNRGGALAMHSADDAGTREYRRGDDLRRVHWRSTARVGELMVRREERPWQRRGVVVLDDRITAHRGLGTGSSFEWAVSAAASITDHLCRSGFATRLLSTQDALRLEEFATHSEGILDRLADMQLAPTASIVPAIAALRALAADARNLVTVSVTGPLSRAETEQLAATRSGTTTAIAVLLDTATWEPRRHGPAPTGADTTADPVDVTARTLTGSGWRVVRAGVGDALDALWQNVTVASTVDSPDQAPRTAGAR